MKTVADRIIAFNETLMYSGPLPKGIGIMNPFRENQEILPVSSSFYRKFYNDDKPRHLILGINPGRFGAGVTGVPFTDTKRLNDQCGIHFAGKVTHEPSSVFVYDVIEAYGGVERFYGDFYINSVFPLGFTVTGEGGKARNYNYYDSRELTAAIYDFVVENIWKQIGLGMKTDLCYCFGTGKNEQFIRMINQKYNFFKEILALEHPRYVMQYKFNERQQYIGKYMDAFHRIQTSEMPEKRRK